MAPVLRVLDSWWFRAASGLALAGFVLRQGDAQALSLGFRSVVWTWLGMAVTLRMVALVAASLRWQVLLAPMRAIGLGPIVSATMAGMAVSAAVSLQAAEVARPLFLSRHARIDVGAVAATVVIDGLFELFGILTLFLASLIVFHGADPGHAVSRTAMGASAGGLLVVPLVALFLLRRLRVVAGRGPDWVRDRRWLPKTARRCIARHFQSFGIGLSVLNCPTSLAKVTAYTVLISAASGVSVWLSLLAFGAAVPWPIGFLLLGFIAVGGLLPTPGAIGGFHAACHAGLLAFTTLHSAAAVVPILGVHAVYFAPPAAVGALCLVWRPRLLPENPL